MRLPDVAYLSSDDYISSPSPRRCTLHRTVFVPDTGQELWQCEASPPLPGELARQGEPISQILLGIVDPQVSFNDLGKVPFMVDIYAAKLPFSSHVKSSGDLMRIGCGLLHTTLAEAVKNSPLED